MKTMGMLSGTDTIAQKFCSGPMRPPRSFPVTRPAPPGQSSRSRKPCDEPPHALRASLTLGRGHDRKYRLFVRVASSSEGSSMPGGDPGIPEAESGNNIWARRGILSLAAWGAILTCFAAAGLAILRMLFPRVLFEPPTSFKAGYPTEYTVGDVSEKWMKSQRVWIVRTGSNIYALLGICTHLGFTPRWLGPEDKVRCP